MNYEIETVDYRTIKKGDHIILKNRPVKIFECLWCKCYKKDLHIIGFDLLTSKKLENMYKKLTP